jgi:hypothetical protein
MLLQLYTPAKACANNVAYCCHFVMSQKWDLSLVSKGMEQQINKQTNKPYLDKLYTDDKLDKFNQFHVVTIFFFKLCYNITYPNALPPPTGGHGFKHHLAI